MKIPSGYRFFFGFLIVTVLAIRLFLSGVYLFPDGQGYFSYLSSIFYDGDLQLYNDFVNLRIPTPLALNPNGYVSNVWAFGTTFFWAPFYLAGRVFGSAGANPYSGWFWSMINFGTMLYALAALWLIFDSLKTLGFGKKEAAISTVLSFFGTPMCFYTLVVPSTSHGISAFCVCLFLWFWIRSMNNPGNPGNPARNYRYVLLGILAGLMTMTRSQDGLFIICPACEWLYGLIRKKLPLSALLRNAAVFSASFLAAFSPQLLIWKFIHGGFLAAPESFSITLKNPVVSRILFSPYHGLLYWTPLFFAAFTGLALSFRKYTPVAAAFLLTLSAQVLVNSLWVQWWEGHSFGLRQTTGSILMIAFGSGLLWRLSRPLNRALKTLLSILIVAAAAWTASLCMHSYLGLNLIDYMSPENIFRVQAGLFRGLAKSSEQLFSHTHPDLPATLLLTAIASVFLLVMHGMKRLFERRRFGKITLILLALIFLLDLKIMLAHSNKPSYLPDRGKFATPAELRQFFIGQAKVYEDKYLAETGAGRQRFER